MISALGCVIGVIGVLLVRETERAESDLMHALLCVNAALLIIVGTLFAIRPY